jgi:hypothetical protein
MGVTDPSHAFYLGYELMKAKTALTLSKNYRQDQALEWGFLTEPEESHLARRRQRANMARNSQREESGSDKPVSNDTTRNNEQHDESRA